MKEIQVILTLVIGLSVNRAHEGTHENAGHWHILVYGLQVQYLSLNRLFIFLVFFLATCAARGILVPQPGIELVSPEVEAWSLNRWTTAEFQEQTF